MKNDDEFYLLGMKKCNIFVRMVEERKMKKEKNLFSPSFNEIYEKSNINHVEKKLINSISEKDNSVTQFIKIITEDIPKVYPNLGMFLKLRICEGYTRLEIMDVLNVSERTYYRIRKDAIRQIGLIYCALERKSRKMNIRTRDELEKSLDKTINNNEKPSRNKAISLDVLRDITGCNNKYTVKSNFMNRVIQQPLDEINNKTTIDIATRNLVSKKSTVGVMFSVAKKDNNRG